MLMRKAILPLLFTLPLLAADLDFKEAFADPATREVSLEKLIPGTRDWFFYHALDHQLAGRSEAFAKTMADWKAISEAPTRSVGLAGFDTLRNRELLLRYESDPQKNLATLIEKLDLKFDDTRPDAREVEKLPSTLDLALVTREAFITSATDSQREPWRASQQHQLLRDLSEVEKFSDERTRYYLTELRRADYPGITALVSRGLSLKEPIRFGDVPLHQELTLAQLDELLIRHPALRSDFKFTPLYLAKLRTHSDAKFIRDTQLHAEHLKKCQAFARTLPPAQISLKTHILYHHLRLQRELGNYPLKDFIEYVAIPSGQERTVFCLERLCDEEVVFENSAHDFPQRIIYRLAPDGALDARIEGEINGQHREVTFPMHKVDCVSGDRS